MKQIPANRTFLTSVNIRIMSLVGHARANEKKNGKLSSSDGDFGIAVFIDLFRSQPWFDS